MSPATSPSNIATNCAKDTRSLYVAEAVVALFFLGAVALYRYFGLALRNPWYLYASRVGSAFALYGVGLVIAALVCRLRDVRSPAIHDKRVSIRQSLAAFRAQYLGLRGLLEDLRLLHAIGAMFFVFIQLKHLIPLVNANVYDNSVAAAERNLFFGRLLGVHLLDWLGPEAAPTLSSLYGLWYSYMAIVIVIVVLGRQSEWKQEFVAAFSLLWLLGVAVVYAYPTWGPCFSSPSDFATLPSTRMTAVQAGLWRMKLSVESAPLTSNAIFLISGLPSLHLATTILGSFYMSKQSRLLAAISWIFVAITFVTTLYFGWHFFVDDVAAAPLVIIAIALARLFVRRGVASTQKA